MQVSPYLNFKGQCEEAFKFYEKSLGGKMGEIMTWGNSPMAKNVSPDWHNKVMHTTLTVGTTTLMGADAPPEHYQQPQGLSIALAINDEAEAQRVFAALAEGGKVQMPIQKTFWARLFGMTVDKFGIPWMVNCE